MKFAAYIFAFIACLTFTVSAPLDLESRELGSIEEVNAFFAQIVKREEDELVDLAARDDIPILTTLFTALNKSGLVPPLVKILATNKVTEPLLVNGINFFLKLLSLDDLLSAVDSSNLAVDLVVKALTYQEFFPGLYQIVQDLRSGASTTPAKQSLNVFQLSTAVAPILSTMNSVQGSGAELSLAMNSLGVDTNENTGIIGGILQPVAAANEAVGSASATKVLPATLAAGSAIPTGSIPSGSAGVGSATSGASKASSATSAASKSSSTASATTTAASSSSSSSSSSSGSRGGLLSGILGTIGSFFGFKRELPVEALVTRDNKILNQLVGSLEKSGLAMSVVYNIVVDTEMHPFVEDLLKKIVTSNTITLDGLSSALESTDLLNHAVVNLLKQNALGIHFS